MTISDFSITISHLKQIVQKLRPHTIETYGEEEISTSLMACDSIKTIRFIFLYVNPNEEYSRYTLVFEFLLLANVKYMNIKYPDKKDVINPEYDDQGNILTEDHIRNLMHKKPTLEHKNCSISTIIYLDIPDYEDLSVSVNGWYNHIYPTITNLIVPIDIFHLSHVINTYPNVKTFFYREPSYCMELRRKETLQNLIKDHPNIEFKQAPRSYELSQWYHQANI
jgi:hypothetical protein